MNFFKHLKVVMRHKWYVMKACFKCGLYVQGITHDLSKLYPSEFFPLLKYYQGTRSPIKAEKEQFGYSKAWQAHKGRNKHHWMYWIDTDTADEHVIAVPMPPKYLSEMMCDWIGAGKAYDKNWTITTFKDWWKEHRDKQLLSPATKFAIDCIVEYSTNEELLYCYIEKSYIEKFYTWYACKEEHWGVKKYKIVR